MLTVAIDDDVNNVGFFSHGQSKFKSTCCPVSIKIIGNNWIDLERGGGGQMDTIAVGHTVLVHDSNV